jgi:syntaxin 16
MFSFLVLPCSSWPPQTAIKVEEGVKQVEAAERQQKMSRMMMCIIALIVAIVFLIIIVLLRHA